MLTIETLDIPGYEKVIVGRDPRSHLHCIIAIHSTRLGPALGGVRIYPYGDDASALTDALRLARAMTYKTALSQVGIGGGKSVIIADPRTEKTPALLHAFGQVVQSLEGAYIAAEDVGSTPQDMLLIREKTPYVAALPTAASSGDPSRFTAWGIFRGLQAVAEALWKSNDLRGKTVAIQGLGNVGSKVAELLFWHGAKLILTDVDREKTSRFCHIFGAQKIAPDAYCSAECDILCPCAMGGIINRSSVPLLRCKAVAGGANNQLAETEDAVRLHERGILYAPDYAINAGGIINATAEFALGGYNPCEARDKTDLIYLTLKQIFEESKEKSLPTSIVADTHAERCLEQGQGRRTTPIFSAGAH